MEKNVYVEKKVSRESGKEYCSLYIDFGYTKLTISFKISEIAEYCDMRPSQIASLEINKPLLVATFILKGSK